MLISRRSISVLLSNLSVAALVVCPVIAGVAFSSTPSITLTVPSPLGDPIISRLFIDCYELAIFSFCCGLVTFRRRVGKTILIVALVEGVALVILTYMLAMVV